MVPAQINNQFLIFDLITTFVNHSKQEHILTQNIAILGSTGSIGTQALDVVSNYPDLFKVELLTALDNHDLLARQARLHNPAAVIIANADHYQALKHALEDTDIKVYCGTQAIEQEVQNSNIHTVLCALSGFAGLMPTLSAIRAGKKIALANKESLVVAGELVIPLSRQHNAPIIPVDSEHSAIFQCLVGEQSPPKRAILTASGGALRDLPLSQLPEATPQMVLCHPSWSMGAKITVDSATMLNKGFEVIEAHHLFNLKAEQIEVVIHPQSIIHSFVEFADGSLKAQIGTPDMRMPIQYALTFPHRLPMTACAQYNPTQPLTFAEADPKRYPCLQMAYQALHHAGVMPTVLNAAGEVAVAQFLAGKIRYTQIARAIEHALNTIENQKLTTVEQIVEVDQRTRTLIANFK